MKPRATPPTSTRPFWVVLGEDACGDEILGFATTLEAALDHYKTRDHHGKRMADLIRATANLDSPVRPSRSGWDYMLFFAAGIAIGCFLAQLPQ